MNISELKQQLQSITHFSFQLPNGESVPSHFHITEVGKISKHFIDCGGTVRREEVANLQLWHAQDINHRLAPQKLLDIIELSENTLHLGNLSIEIEYQGSTIEKYSLDFDGHHFQLKAMYTDCLAKDACETPRPKQKLALSEIRASNTCTPENGCC